MVTNNKSKIEMIADSALSAVRQYISKEPETVIGVQEVDGEWRVTVEVVERRAVPDTQDLLGRYEVRLSVEGELLGWSQRLIRKRCDRMVSAEEEWVVTG